MATINTLDVLAAESEKHKRIARKIDDLIEDLRSLGEADQAEGPLAAAAVAPVARAGGTISPPGNLAAGPDPGRDLIGLSQTDACMRVLKEAGTPLKREELIKRANARGANITSPANLSTVLSRSSAFDNVSRGYWQYRPEPERPQD